MPRSAVRPVLLAAVAAALPRLAAAAPQCFHDDGVYGALTVTTIGTQCGATYTFGGITGLYMGGNNMTGSCVFGLDHTIDPRTVSVAITAMTNVINASEDVSFLLDAQPYLVTAADIDNTFPSGAGPLVDDGAGNVTTAGYDGRGTVTFRAATGTLSELTLVHTILHDSPNGAIYLVCVDDTLVFDTDGDTILDGDDGTGDFDLDGVANFLDLDSDGDTLPDEIEGLNDADGDGAGNFVDLESDGDGFDDADEGAGDTDLDGVPSFLDLESDGDTLLDADELGLSDPQDTDSDDDALSDPDEATTSPLDADSDDDGLADGAEIATDPADFDTDADGLGDGLEQGDQDEVAGGVSGGLALPFTGTDPAMFAPDGDPASTTDPLIPDTDVGGIGDGVEDLDQDGAFEAGECDPNDPADDLDCIDTDADGLSDLDEGTLGTDPTSADTDGGGVSDGDEVAAGTDPLDAADDVLTTTPGQTGDTGGGPTDTDTDTDADSDSDVDTDADSDADTDADTGDSGSKGGGCGGGGGTSGDAGGGGCAGSGVDRVGAIGLFVAAALARRRRAR